MNTGVREQSRDARYRLVIIGELLPGHSLEGAVATLAQVFTAPPERLRGLFDGARHPVDQAFTADQALDLQQRLERAGVTAQMERIAGADLALRLRTPSRGATSSASTHAEQHWRDAWGDAHVQDEPREDDRLAVFIGRRAPGYLHRFARVRENGRPTFGLSWNWGAVPSPFLWALYRRLWGWAFVIGITDVLLPLVMLILSQHGLLAPRFTTLALLSMVGNRLFWPAVADYLYYRHAHFSLLYLFNMMPGYASEAEIANAGRTSRSAVALGVAFSAVLAVFLWALTGSLRVTGGAPSTVPPPPALLEQDAVPLSPGAGGAGTIQISRQDEVRWGSTRRRMGELDWAIREWLAGESDPDAAAVLTLRRLRDERVLPADVLFDGWDNEIRYLPDRKGYRLVSAGPDQLFGTEDDIVFRRVLAQQTSP